jgi:tetratricopeptide (TPR) repeat protein
MANDQSNKTEAERLYVEALQIDPANETVLTMFAIFKCNGFDCDDWLLFISIDIFNFRNQFEDAANLYERAIHCTRGEEKLLQYAALLYAIRAQGRAIKRLSLNFPGGFPPAGGFPNWMGGMA